jgi:signal transduction histidine kinase
MVGDVLATEIGPRALARGHGLEVAGEGPVFARGDEARVLQIGRILAENAIVHTPPGTTVTVTTGLVGGRATLSVSDDGPGIPGDAHDAVFDRFVRLGGMVSSGSGLGLAIARELAELMGGTIELVSGPGGTRFTLALAADVPAREPAVPA